MEEKVGNLLLGIYLGGIVFFVLVTVISRIEDKDTLWNVQDSSLVSFPLVALLSFILWPIAIPAILIDVYRERRHHEKHHLHHR